MSRSDRQPAYEADRGGYGVPESADEIIWPWSIDDPDVLTVFVADDPDEARREVDEAAATEIGRGEEPPLFDGVSFITPDERDLLVKRRTIATLRRIEEAERQGIREIGEAFSERDVTFYDRVNALADMSVVSFDEEQSDLGGQLKIPIVEYQRIALGEHITIDIRDVEDREVET